MIKKRIAIPLAILIIGMSLVRFSLNFMNRGFVEQQYEIDYAILNELFDYYEQH